MHLCDCFVIVALMPTALLISPIQSKYDGFVHDLATWNHENIPQCVPVQYSALEEILLSITES